MTVWKRLVRATPIDHPSHAVFQTSLGIALEVHFKNGGQLRDLDEAVRAHRIAAHLIPANQPNRWKVITNLANQLHSRSVHTGSPEDLNEAIRRGWESIATISDESKHLAGPLINVSNALQTRFERTGSADDLDTAIEAARRAVEVTPAACPEEALAHACLGGALITRFGRTNTRKDLDESVNAFEVTLKATPADHPSLAGRLSNHGSALLTRFSRVNDDADLRRAIDDLRSAVAVTLAGHPSRGGYLIKLAAALDEYGKLTGQPPALDEAVRIAREAIDTTPENHPSRGGHLIGLGNALHVRYDFLGDPADLDAAIRIYEDAANDTGLSPSVRIEAAHEAARHLVESEPHEAAVLMENAVHQLPELASRHMRRVDQQRALDRLPVLTSDAAALVLAHASGTSHNRAVRALQVLESGRGVLLSQAMEVRDDLTELRHRHPELAARFVDLRNRLDQGVDDISSFVHLIAQRKSGIDPQSRYQLVTEFNKVLAQIRAKNGFTSFGLPPSLDEILSAATEGPVVMFNVSRHRSDAILITAAGVTSTPLPGLEIRALIRAFESFHQAVHTSMHDSIDAVYDAQTTLTQTLEWLWDVAAEPVLEALGFHDQPLPGEPWPRVWWAPGGVLGLLPIHAAGYHDDPAGKSDRRTVLDRVVSSYTPTIRTLHHARGRALATTTSHHALIVAMPTTPGQMPLAHVRAEATRLANRLPNSVTLIEPETEICKEGDQGSRPTRERVLSHLPASPIAHFACHAITDPRDPSESRLLLHDHNTAPLTVASLGPLNLDQAHLAYLSACSTSVVHTPGLVDEAIHLTSAFQVAGYSHVVGTLWEIHDQVAEEVADTFYSKLINDHYGLDAKRAAYALHHTVRAVRDRLPNTPFLWAAYLHAGA
ncbi:tetratricopeptide (TPR) repeat protein [Saccharopolyspora gloriosae]|uniref:Tetratricopeptide (TPR) repeat protein n=1 Tax=Saccharopolyspora gloriosae TaxID=455344 RepID=A0A840NI66_9PSEU|nr:tetratricopeptide (TPR) repeat protein [Saccharopolyspora gloriosae]